MACHYDSPSLVQFPYETDLSNYICIQKSVIGNVKMQIKFSITYLILGEIVNDSGMQWL